MEPAAQWQSIAGRADHISADPSTVHSQLPKWCGSFGARNRSAEVTQIVGLMVRTLGAVERTALLVSQGCVMGVDAYVAIAAQ